jgi:hypothetical protein
MYAPKLDGSNTLLTRLQAFQTANIVPNLYAIAATAVVPSVLNRTQGILSQYGLFGDLVHVGSVAVAFSAFVYVLLAAHKSSTTLTEMTGSPRSARIFWTATDDSATVNNLALAQPSPELLVKP